MENIADKGKHEIKQSKQKQEKNVSKLHIGNSNLCSKEKDLRELFGLNATKYLRETCSLNLAMNDETGQSEEYAFVSALKYVYDELVKLNDVNFHGFQIKMKESKFTREETIVISSPAKNQPIVVNENLLKQNSLQNLPLVPDKRNYCEAAQQHPSPYNTLVFTDSILKSICVHEFNSVLRNRKAKMLNFHGSSSKQMLHYIDIHLEDKSVDTALLHVGLNDLLNDDNKSNVDNLMSKMHEIVEKCK